METLGGSGTGLTLSDINASGVSRLQWAWGLGDTTATAIRGVGSNRCLDVPGASTVWGTQLQIYDCNGGTNQSWLLPPQNPCRVRQPVPRCRQQQRHGRAKVETWDCAGATNQQWSVSSDGTITSVQTATASTWSAPAPPTALLDVWPCNGGSNQQWVRS